MDSSYEAVQNEEANVVRGSLAKKETVAGGLPKQALQSTKKSGNARGFPDFLHLKILFCRRKTARMSAINHPEAADSTPQPSSEARTALFKNKKIHMLFSKHEDFAWHPQWDSNPCFRLERAAS